MDVKHRAKVGLGLLKAMSDPAPAHWMDASELLLEQYWGATQLEKDASERELVRELAQVGFQAYSQNADALYHLVTPQWVTNSNLSFSTPWPSATDDARLELLANIYQRDHGLSKAAESIHISYLILGIIEGVIRPSLGALAGTLQIAAGCTPKDRSVLEQPDGRLRAFSGVVEKTKKALKHYSRATESRKAILPFLESLESKQGSGYVYTTLADVRNIIAHHDFGVDREGNLIWGYNTLQKYGADTPSTLDREDLHRNYQSFCGLNSTLTSWMKFTELMVANWIDSQAEVWRRIAVDTIRFSI